ncbi:MAG: NYN domain-containing protein, partial [Actinobacteria bacterium]|nr:NYN domain-containing protein [Actinomycetota bacterium]
MAALDPSIGPAWKTAVIVDLPSLASISARAGTRVDYIRLLGRLAGGRMLVRALAFATIDADQPEAYPHLTLMARNGYRVITKPMRHREDGTLRASLHVEMTLAALELASRVELLTLLTSDADLAPLIDAVQRRGVRVELVTSPEPRTQSLIEIADATISVDQVLSELALATDTRRPRGERPAVEPPRLPLRPVREPLPERGRIPAEVRPTPAPLTEAAPEAPLGPPGPP